MSSESGHVEGAVGGGRRMWGIYERVEVVRSVFDVRMRY